MHWNSIKVNGICHITLNTLPDIDTLWETYIERLEEWDKTLVKENIDIDQQKLIQRLRNEENIYICSDGGAKDTVGLYGVAIADEESVLIAITGRAFGFMP